MTVPEPDPDAASIAASLRVRASTPVERAEALREQLRDCEAAGRIGSFKLHSWPREVVVSADRPERAMVRGYESYRVWAGRAGVTLEPAFATRTRRSIVTGEEIEVLVLPETALALYDDGGDLVGVYPHSDAGATYTVADALARVRVGTVPVPLSGRTVRVEGAETCPDCHGLLGNWRELYVCPGCRWIGSVDADGAYEQVTVQRPDPSDAGSAAPGAPVGRRGD